jgi:L-ascorbate metabolism protein UlaG (beta-lactamase superfamily)
MNLHSEHVGPHAEREGPNKIRPPHLIISVNFWVEYAAFVCYYLYMTLCLLALLFLVGISTLYRWWMPFGGSLDDVHKRAVKNSPNYAKGKFVNLIPTPMDANLKDTWSMLVSLLTPSSGRHPSRRLQPDVFDKKALLAKGTNIVWLGHSTCLVRINNKTLLIDPVFSKRVSPFQFAGPKRFAGGLNITVADLPPIDAVLISHDHYDHLDYGSIRSLYNVARHFFAPLGVGAHLERWGVAADRISEFDWWDETNFEGIRLVCTPSRHFSGRRIGDRSVTLWASWVITSGSRRLFFSGDTGYGPHFAEIGKRYGPFDLAFMECGQYDRRWENIHMMPEQTVKAAQELGSKLLLPIHWGAFVLAFHTWTDPVKRATNLAHSVGLAVVTPRLGQVIHMAKSVTPTEPWWHAFER